MGRLEMYVRKKLVRWEKKKKNNTEQGQQGAWRRGVDILLGAGVGSKGSDEQMNLNSR